MAVPGGNRILPADCGSKEIKEALDMMTEFGQQNTDVVLLLHGGGLSWWNYREIATLLAER